MRDNVRNSRTLNGLVNDAIADAQRVEVESYARVRAIANCFILVAEVAVETGTIVAVTPKSVGLLTSAAIVLPSVALCSQVELLLVDSLLNANFSVQLRQCT